MNSSLLELMILEAFDKLRQIYEFRPLLLGTLAGAQELIIDNKDVLAADLAAKGFQVTKIEPKANAL